MRPIKFRIFDTVNHRWLTSGIESWAEVLDLGAWQDARFAISQLTGLKDSKGVDIWEGDLVRWTHPMEDVGVVEYSIGDKFGAYPLTAFWGLKVVRFSGHCPFQQDDTYEVVGNVYVRP